MTKCKKTNGVSISGSVIDAILLLILFILLLGDCLQKSLRLHRFKSDWDEIWQDCFSSECASIDKVRFPIWRHTFKMAPWRDFMQKAAICLVHMQLCMQHMQKHPLLPTNNPVYSSWSIYYIIFVILVCSENKIKSLLNSLSVTTK